MSLAEGEVAVLQLPIPVSGLEDLVHTMQAIYGSLVITTQHDHGPDVMVLAREGTG